MPLKLNRSRAAACARAAAAITQRIRLCAISSTAGYRAASSTVVTSVIRWVRKPRHAAVNRTIRTSNFGGPRRPFCRRQDR